MIKEQEQYQQILARVINDTENQKLSTMDEIVQRLIQELTVNTNVKQTMKSIY